jgi:hypothetical protein
MFNNIGLSFGLLIALFVPGCIVYLSIVIGVYKIDILNLGDISGKEV